MRKKKSPKSSRAYLWSRSDLGGLNVVSLFAFFSDLEIISDFLTVFQGLEAFHLDRRKMCEEIFSAIVRSNEAIAFSIAKPLYGSCCHIKLHLQKHLIGVVHYSHPPPTEMAVRHTAP